MAVIIRDAYLESRLAREGSTRSKKTLAGIASDLLIERLTQLDTARGVTTDAHPAPAGPVQDTRTNPIAQTA